MYHVTENICSGRLDPGKMVLNDSGRYAQLCWTTIPEHYPDASLDEYVVMPQSYHGIITIADVGVQNLEPLQNVPRHNEYQHIIPKSVGSIVRGFKIGVTKWFRNNTDISVCLATQLLGACHTKSFENLTVSVNMSRTMSHNGKQILFAIR